MSSTKKISQQQLRQMMKERKQMQSKSSQETTQSAEVKIEEKKIESPLARYDANGRLSCILCDQQITSGSLWSQHISSNSHKNKIEEMKRKKLMLKSAETKNQNKPILKRKMETNDEQITNKMSKDNHKQDIKEEKTEISSDAMETEDTSETKSVAVDNEKTTALPNDFFDDRKERPEENTGINANEEEKEMESESNSLPKGFFDDPVKDAKARKVVYKDPIDEQWEQFQKVIAEENNVSENIIEEDIEELQIDRNLEEIEEQIANWIKVNEMQKRAEMLRNHIVTNSHTNQVKQEEEDIDSDVDEFEVFSNWRSRTALK